MTNGQGNSGGFSGAGFPPPPGQPSQQPPQQPGAAPPQQFGGGAPTMPPPTMPPPNMAGGQGAPNSGFVVDIDADPTWEPIEQTDFLEMDGFYCAKIIKESPRQDGSKTPGVFLTLQIQDEDTKGKVISKFMTDPKASRNDTRFVWRLLWLSMTGNKDQARSAFRYQPGMITGQTVFVKTVADVDKNNRRQITNVDTFVTQAEYEQALKESRHRWKAQPKAATPAGPPPGFGGTGGLPPLPGGPSSPTPQARPPMQGGGFPQQGAPMQQPVPPPQQPTPQSQAPTSVAPQSGFPPPQNAPQGGVPQPGGAPLPGFPPSSN